jgi:hypothetical protein
MRRKGVGVDQVYDARALRVVVGDGGGKLHVAAVEGCYNLLSVVHRYWLNIRFLSYVHWGMLLLPVILPNYISIYMSSVFSHLLLDVVSTYTDKVLSVNKCQLNTTRMFYVLFWLYTQPLDACWWRVWWLHCQPQAKWLSGASSTFLSTDIYFFLQCHFVCVVALIKPFVSLAVTPYSCKGSWWCTSWSTNSNAGLNLLL